MVWHLKDRELEKKLEEFTGGEFVKSLNLAIENNEIDSEFRVYVDFNRKLFNDDNSENCLCFLTRELEEIHEYNPKAWNDSRKVKPPRNVLFRANIHRKGFAGEEWVKHRCILHDGYAWKEVDNFKPWGEIIKLDFDEWIEFRPWED